MSVKNNTEGTSKENKNLTAQTLLIYWRHLKKYRLILIVCAIGMTAAIGPDLYSPILYRRLFDQLSLDRIRNSVRTEIGGIYNTVYLIGFTLLLSWVGWRIHSWMIMKFESLVMKDLTDHCFRYIHNHSPRFFTDTFSGALVKRVNRFAAGFEDIADQVTMNMGVTVIRVIVILCILLWNNAKIGLIFLLWTIVLILFNFFFAKWKLKYDIERAEMDTEVTAHLADTIANAINLKLFASTERENKNFESTTFKHHQIRYKTWKLNLYSDSFLGLSVRALEIIVLLTAIKYWIEGKLTIGDFVFFRSYLSQLTEEVRGIGGNVRRIYETMANANEMTEILLKPHEIVDQKDSKPLIVSKGTIQLSNVKFYYPGQSRKILRNLCLKIKAGEKIGIVGPSGGGKSTVLKLLTRQYDITSGEISIDNQNISRVRQDSLRRSIAFVPQDPILFHRTLLENIRYSRPQATEEEVIQASKMAHCHEFISSFPLGYMTLVGERGVKLSGGERQRVSLARAILMNAPILVLDEATSSLDSESENYIQDSLSKLMVGRTVVAVAHRLSTIRKMDRIVVIKDGHIVEEGHHDLLVKAQNGLYKKLWSLQSSVH